MSLTINHTKVEAGPYVADGTNKTFPFKPGFLATSDLIVMTTDTTTGVVKQLTLNHDYTVTGRYEVLTTSYPWGGNVNFINAPSGVTVAIARRSGAKTQDLTITPMMAFPASGYRRAMMRLFYLTQEKGQHFMGYADAAPSKGAYLHDDFVRIRSAQTGTLAEAYNLEDGDPGNWQEFPSIISADLYYLSGLNQSTLWTPSIPLPAASALQTASSIKTKFAFRASWSAIEATEGARVWTIIDAAQALAAAAGVHWSLSVKAGVDTPAWVYTAGAASYSFTWNQNFPSFGGVTKGQTAKLPIPWDSTYLDKWTNFVTAMATRYKNDATLDHVVLTGMNGITQETLLPHTVASDSLTTPNDANWTTAGYTTGKIETAWATLLALFAAQWGTVKFAGMFGPGFMPFNPPDEGIVLLNSLVATDGYGGDSLGIIMNNALSSGFVWQNISGNSNAIDTGYQFVGAQGANALTAIAKAQVAGAKFIEVYPADLAHL